MSWNHRVIMVDDIDTDRGYAYQLAEVYYNSKGVPEGYCAPFTEADSLEDMEKLLRRFHAALDKPVVDMRGKRHERS